jgi:hypothetical protein
MAVGVGHVRDAVGPHAPGVDQHDAPVLLHLSRGRLTAVRDEVDARILSRLELGAANPELLGSLLREQTAAAGVGVGRNSVSTHTSREGDRSAHLGRRARRCRATRRWGRTELRHPAPGRATACRHQRGQGGHDDGRGSHPGAPRPAWPVPAGVAVVQTPRSGGAHRSIAAVWGSPGSSEAARWTPLVHAPPWSSRSVTAPGAGDEKSMKAASRRARRP